MELFKVYNFLNISYTKERPQSVSCVDPKMPTAPKLRIKVKINYVVTYNMVINDCFEDF